MSDAGLSLIVILMCFGLAGGIVARLKGNSFWMWFVVSFCVPFVGLLAAVLFRSDREQLRRQCPRCHRVVMLEDAVCMHCGTELDFPKVAISPAAVVRGDLRSQQGEFSS
jgi:hypothetical protein